MWGLVDSAFQGESYQDIYIITDTILLAGARPPGDIIFRKSTDRGTSWLPLQVVGYGAYVSHAVSAPTIGFVYQITQYSQEVIFKRSTNNGATWFDSLMLSDCDSVGSQWPVISADTCNGMHATWYDYKYSPYAWTGDIFYRTSGDLGTTWEAIDSLTVMHRAVASDILAEGNSLHLVWEDDRNAFNDNFEIYYRTSMDLGQSWTNEQRLTNASGWSRTPALVYGNEYLHLFWSDQRDDSVNRTDEIYYKRKNLTGITEGAQAAIGSNGLSLHCATILTNDLLVKYDLGWHQQGEVMIVDIAGRVVAVFSVRQASGEFILDSNSDLQNGVYFLVLRFDGGCLIKKVLVVR